jgi:hypothetical protein
VVSLYVRDADLERELQREIDPTPVATVDAGRPTRAEAPEAPPADREIPAEATAPLDSTKLAGIWDGTFTFRGGLVGSFSGEVSVAVEDGSVEVADFCPDRGGTLTARASGHSASWQGEMTCPPIAIHGCAASVIKYTSAQAMLKGATLVLVAAGSVEVPAGCQDSSGAISTTFVARRANYVYLVVNSTHQRATCEWPRDWEDLGSTGSMPCRTRRRPTPRTSASSGPGGPGGGTSTHS